jgi:hypothetical protein
MTQEVTPTEAVIARLTLQNEELHREVSTLRDQLNDIEKKAIELVRASKVSYRFFS